jgi:hypothetical protein
MEVIDASKPRVSKWRYCSHVCAVRRSIAAMRKWLIALVIAGTGLRVAAQPDQAVREQRERELALVQHLRRHLMNPGDGLALAADRRDLQRMRAGAVAAVAPAPMPGVAMTDADLLDTLAVVADLWHARLDDRIPFGLMPRDRLSPLARAQAALGQLQSHATRGDRDHFMPEMLVEVQALSRFAAGQGDLSDQAIDVALRIADQAATGQPMLGAGPYPMMPPGAGYPPTAYPPPSGSYPESPAGQPPGPAGPPPPSGPPPSPPSGGPSPYDLPPGYAGYAPSAQGVAGSTGCQTLRQSASAAGSMTDMLRAAECWSGQPTWPGWAALVYEALDWAVTYARLDRNCDGLDTAIDKVRELGSKTAIAGLQTEMTSLAERAERERRWMRSQNLCR